MYDPIGPLVTSYRRVSVVCRLWTGRMAVSVRSDACWSGPTTPDGFRQTCASPGSQTLPYGISYVYTWIWAVAAVSAV